jgi:malonyl-CoA/methylmalonyl-CoA synthetase
MTNPLYDRLFGRHAGAETPFMILPDERVITHDAFLKMAARTAHAMAALGLVPGDRLAVQIGKTPEALAVYAACAQAGVIFLPLNMAYTGAEIDYFVENSGAKLVLCDEKKRAGLTDVAQRNGARN